MTYTIKIIRGFLLLLTYAGILSAEGTLLHFKGNQDDPNLINIVFLAEGYTEKQQQDFKDDVSWLSHPCFRSSLTCSTCSTLHISMPGVFMCHRRTPAPTTQDDYRDTYFEATFGNVVEKERGITNELPRSRASRYQDKSQKILYGTEAKLRGIKPHL